MNKSIYCRGCASKRAHIYVLVVSARLFNKQQIMIPPKSLFQPKVSFHLALSWLQIIIHVICVVVVVVAHRWLQSECRETACNSLSRRDVRVERRRVDGERPVVGLSESQVEHNWSAWPRDVREAERRDAPGDWRVHKSRNGHVRGRLRSVGEDEQRIGGEVSKVDAKLVHHMQRDASIQQSVRRAGTDALQDRGRRVRHWWARASRCQTRLVHKAARSQV